jgi:periplasmic divalent cation tolerance protein
MPKNNIICVLTSVETAEQAQYISHELVKHGLAACVQQTKGHSTYQWKDKIEVCNEYYLTIKTRTELKPAVMDWLQHHHPYDTPEMIILTAETSEHYNTWLHSETNKA